MGLNMRTLIRTITFALLCLLLAPACGSDGDGGEGEVTDTGATTGDQGAVKDEGPPVTDVKVDPGGGEGDKDDGEQPPSDPGEPPVDGGGGEEDPGEPVPEDAGPDTTEDMGDTGEGDDVPVVTDVTEPTDGGGTGAQASFEIGPEGGTIGLAGAVLLSIPENALPEEETITLTVDAGLNATAPFTPLGLLVRFEPEGLFFEAAAEVSFELPATGLPIGPTTEQISVWWTTPAGGWTAVPTTHADGRFTAPVHHFSGGGLGWFPGPCEDNMVRCGDHCMDTQSNAYACGDCDTICKGTEACIDGTCQCPPDYTRCGELCRNLNKDRRFCGSCDTACEDSASCESGVCTTPECAGGLSACRGECVDYSKDERNCGGCRNMCNVGQRCEEGVCKDACLPFEKLCFGEDCANLDSDPDHCGQCGHGCGYNESCVDGECKVVMGACCSEEQECAQSSERECTEFGFQGEGSTCEGVVCCPPPCDQTALPRCAEDGQTVVTCEVDEDLCLVVVDTPCPPEAPDCTGHGECVGCDDVCADGCCEGPGTLDCVPFTMQDTSRCGAPGESCAACEAPNDVACQEGVCTCDACDRSELISCADATTIEICTVGLDDCAVSSLQPCAENHVCVFGGCYSTMQAAPPAACELPLSSALSGPPEIGGGAATFGALLPDGGCALGMGLATTGVPPIVTFMLNPQTNVWTALAHFDGTETGEQDNGWMVGNSSLGQPKTPVSGGELVTVSGFRSVEAIPASSAFDLTLVNVSGASLLLRLLGGDNMITVNHIGVGAPPATTDTR